MNIWSFLSFYKILILITVIFCVLQYKYCNLLLILLHLNQHKTVQKNMYYLMLHNNNNKTLLS